MLNTKLDQNINKNILIDNIKNNYLEKRKIKTNDLFTYSQTTCIKNKVIILYRNPKKIWAIFKYNSRDKYYLKKIL